MNSDFVLAVHALVYLNHKAETLSSDILAENICTNAARVRRVLAKLKKAGLVETKEGRVGGGYYFSLDPESTNLNSVAKALDVSFISSGWRSGDPHMACRVASGMAGIMDGIYMDMDTQCKKYLESISIADIDRKIFGKKAGGRSNS